MNNIIVSRFESYRRLLIESLIVFRFTLVKQRVAATNGYVRMRATLGDGGLLEFSEYIELNGGLLLAHEYSFHWQDSQQQLVRRWDNAKHYPQLPHAPHHVHFADGSVTGNPQVPTLDFVLTMIEQHQGDK